MWATSGLQAMSTPSTTSQIVGAGKVINEMGFDQGLQNLGLENPRHQQDSGFIGSPINFICFQEHRSVLQIHPLKIGSGILQDFFQAEHEAQPVLFSSISS
jgi:hypothetical protein